MAGAPSESIVPVCTNNGLRMPSGDGAGEEVAAGFGDLVEELQLLQRDAGLRNELLGLGSIGKVDVQSPSCKMVGAQLPPELACIAEECELKSSMLDDMAQQIATLSWQISQCDEDMEIMHLQKAMTESEHVYEQSTAHLSKALRMRGDLRSRLASMSERHAQGERAAHAAKVECHEYACKVRELQQRLDSCVALLAQESAVEESEAGGRSIDPDVAPWAFGLAGRLQTHEDFCMRHLLLMVARHQQCCEELTQRIPGASADVGALRRHSEARSADIERLALRHHALQQMLLAERALPGHNIHSGKPVVTQSRHMVVDSSGKLDRTLGMLEDLQEQLARQKQQHQGDVLRLSQEIRRLRMCDPF